MSRVKTNCIFVCILLKVIIVCQLFSAVWFYLTSFDFKYTDSARTSLTNCLVCDTIYFYECYSGLTDEDASFRVIVAYRRVHALMPKPQQHCLSSTASSDSLNKSTVASCIVYNVG